MPMTTRSMIIGALLVPLAGWAVPPKAIVAAPDPQAGFTTGLEFSYKSKLGVRRERRVFLWYPSSEQARPHRYNGVQEGQVALNGPLQPGRHPLVIFSHGFWGAADQSIFLMEGLARAGFIVAAVHHDDALPNQHKKRVDLPNFVAAKSWDEDRFFDRREDMSALLDFLLESDRAAGSVLFGHVMRGAVGVAGHSLGGYTALAMAGAWKSWKDERLAAALLLSPYTHPFYFNGDLKAVTVPVMFQGGTLDLGITPFLKPIYRRIEAPSYFLVMNQVGHFGWTNFATLGRTTVQVLGEGNTKLMADYAVAFFDRHLRGVAREDVLSGGDKELHRWFAKP